MKKILSLLALSSLFLVGCDSEETVTSQVESQEFNLQINDQCEVEGNTITIDLDNEVDSYSLINSFTIPTSYTWELHKDVECNPEKTIKSKTAVKLTQGDNIYYALFASKTDPEDIYFYQIVLHREQIFTVYVAGNEYECLEGQALKDLDIKIPTKEHYTNVLLVDDEIVNMNYIPTKDTSVYIKLVAEKVTLTFNDFDKKTYKTYEADYAKDFTFEDDLPVPTCPETDYSYSHEFSHWDTSLYASNIDRDLTINPISTTVSYTINSRVIDGNDTIAVYGQNNYNDVAKYIRLEDSYSSAETYQIGYDSDYYNYPYSVGFSTNVVTIEIPTSVTKINNYAFNGNTQYNNPNDSALTTINYLGTMAQWNAIEKGEFWNIRTQLTKIVCTDGTITNF